MGYWKLTDWNGNSQRFLDNDLDKARNLFMQMKAQTPIVSDTEPFLCYLEAETNSKQNYSYTFVVNNGTESVIAVSDINKLNFLHGDAKVYDEHNLFYGLISFFKTKSGDFIFESRSFDDLREFRNGKDYLHVLRDN